MEFIELDKIYRQSDIKFIQLLTAIRNNSITDYDLTTINARYNSSFEPCVNDFYIYLTTTNADAELINSQRLKVIKNKEFTFKGIIEDDFPKEPLPTLIDLKLKVGSQVMMLNNDSNARFINGTIGKILDIDTVSPIPKLNILLETGKKVSITPYPELT